MTDEELLKVYAYNNAADGVRFDMHYREQMLRAHQYALRAVYETGRQDGPRWIPVAERLPDNGQLVVLRYTNGMHWAGRWHSAISAIYTDSWLPLPDLPQRAAPLASEAETDKRGTV